MFFNNKLLNFLAKAIFIFFDFLWMAKNKKIWVLAVSQNEKFDGNVRAIYEEVEKNNYDFNLKIIAKSKVHKNYNIKNGIKWGSVKHFYTLLNAGVVMYHHNAFDTGLLCLPIHGRLNYRISHGIHFKKVERAYKLATFKDRILSTKNIIPYHGVSSKLDALSACSYFHVYLDNLDITGAAKNDILLSNKLTGGYRYEENKLLEKIQDKKLITYAPTWRENGSAYLFANLEIEKLNNFLEKQGLIFGYAGHHYLKNREVPSGDNFIDLNKIGADIQIILRNTEILITDYSSVWIDFLLMDKPIIFFNYDELKFIHNRGTLLDISSLEAGIKVSSFDRLLEVLNETNIPTSNKLTKNLFHQYSDGKNAHRTLSAIMKRSRDL